MPVIGRFYGISVKMFLSQKEHEPPHVHAVYWEYIGMFNISDGKCLMVTSQQRGRN